MLATLLPQPATSPGTGRHYLGTYPGVSLRALDSRPRAGRLGVATDTRPAIGVSMSLHHGAWLSLVLLAMLQASSFRHDSMLQVLWGLLLSTYRQRASSGRPARLLTGSPSRPATGNKHRPRSGKASERPRAGHTGPVPAIVISMEKKILFLLAASDLTVQRRSARPIVRFNTTTISSASSLRRRQPYQSKQAALAINMNLGSPGILLYQQPSRQR